MIDDPLEAGSKKHCWTFQNFRDVNFGTDSRVTLRGVLL